MTERQPYHEHVALTSEQLRELASELAALDPAGARELGAQALIERRGPDLQRRLAADPQRLVEVQRLLAEHGPQALAAYAPELDRLVREMAQPAAQASAPVPRRRTAEIAPLPIEPSDREPDAFLGCAAQILFALVMVTLFVALTVGSDNRALWLTLCGLCAAGFAAVLWFARQQGRP